MLEDFTDTLIGFCGTFKILVGTNLLAHFLALYSTASAMILLKIASRAQFMHNMIWIFRK
jgi:hypothetical protein